MVFRRCFLFIVITLLLFVTFVTFFPLTAKTGPSENLKAGAYYNQIISTFVKIEQDMCLANQILTHEQFELRAKSHIESVRPLLEAGVYDLKYFVTWHFYIHSNGNVFFGFKRHNNDKNVTFVRLYCKRDVITNSYAVNYRIQHYPVETPVDKIVSDLIHSINWNAKVTYESEEKPL
jgi:hypothetical protein